MIAQGFEMPIDSALRDAIAAAMKDGKKISQIADEAGVDYGILHRYIKGVRTDLRMSTIQTLCNHFKLDLTPISVKIATPKKPAPKRKR